MEAAVQEFIEKGYHNTSLLSIANRAGFSKGGVYHYFTSKDEILIKATNEYFMEPVFVYMEEAMTDANPSKGLSDFIDKFLTFWSNHPHEMAFIMLSLSKFLEKEEMWSDMNMYSQNMILFYEGLLQKGIECGEFRTHDTRSRATILFSSLDGIISYIVMSESMDTRDTIEHFKNFFIKDILI